MKKISYILTLIVFIGIASIGDVQCQNTDDRSTYYHYAQRKNLTVAYIQNFGLDYKTSVNVTMIQANNNSAWDELSYEFQLNELNDRQIKMLQSDEEVLQLLVRNNTNPCNLAPKLKNGYIDWRRACYCIVGYLSKTIWIFHTHNVKQIELISERFIYHTYKEEKS